MSLAGNVVVFDEAHNLVDAVNGVHSCSVSLPQLRGAGRWVGHWEGKGGGHPDVLLAQAYK